MRLSHGSLADIELSPFYGIQVAVGADDVGNPALRRYFALLVNDRE
jgi:hypothetical protein